MEFNDIFAQSKFKSLVSSVNSICIFYFLLSLETLPGCESAPLRLLSSLAPAPGRYPLADCVERGEGGRGRHENKQTMHSV